MSLIACIYLLSAEIANYLPKVNKFMISFKNDDFLGKTVTKFNIYCSIGAEPLRSVSQLRFAAGWHKFSSLCGFVF
jgi:hypothetical protein